ncbi:carcinoembryonic antigen-related cell adhesion molecule 21-like [Cavia porcellus]|uniref:carcinoembryonic antigen-related cell adhesion molecule 21-like n=1 Tax=Cavia porcellus TaxID=10141 RepID=UPI002FE30545
MRVISIPAHQQLQLLLKHLIRDQLVTPEIQDCTKTQGRTDAQLDFYIPKGNTTLDLGSPETPFDGDIKIRTVQRRTEQAADTMAPRTATSFIGIVPWQGLLLTASLLTFWSPPTTAQPVVQAIPPNVVEGENVLLQLIHAATNHWGYKWYRGTIVASDMMIATFSKVSEQNTTGNAYTGQEIIYSNGSLLIRNITRENATNYIVEVILDDLIVLQASGEFRVYSPVSQPSISTSSGTLTEDDSVVLDCHSRDTGITFSWLFEKQKLRLNKRMSLSTIGNSLTISPVKPWDAGEYQCEVSNPAISKRSESLFLSVTGKPTKPEPADASMLPNISTMLVALAILILISAMAYNIFFRQK